MKPRPSWSNGPIVSIAIGVKIYLVWSSSYLFFFLVAAISAAPPAATAVSTKYDGANVSIIVTSQIRERPLFHGIRVWPSGLFPSRRVRPAGSLIDGVPALMRLHSTISLIKECLACLPKPNVQAKPCDPLAETIVPHGHVCGAQMTAPSLKPTATLISSSLSLKP